MFGSLLLIVNYVDVSYRILINEVTININYLIMKVKVIYIKLNTFKTIRDNPESFTIHKPVPKYTYPM